MRTGENIRIVTQAVKSCLETGKAVAINTQNQETAKTLADLIEWLGYGKLVYTQVTKGDRWQVVVVKKQVDGV